MYLHKVLQFKIFEWGFFCLICTLQIGNTALYVPLKFLMTSFKFLLFPLSCQLAKKPVYNTFISVSMGLFVLFFLNYVLVSVFIILLLYTLSMSNHTMYESSKSDLVTLTFPWLYQGICHIGHPITIIGSAYKYLHRELTQNL